MGRAGDEKQVISLQWPNLSFFIFGLENYIICLLTNLSFFTQCKLCNQG